jgi:chemotaxis signal transduction protein
MNQQQPLSDSQTMPRVLRERAQRLARPLAPVGPEQEKTALVILALDRDSYGIELRYVQGIHTVGRVTPVPGTASFWAGVTSLRGRLYPVLDLGHYLGMPAVDIAKNKIVLVAAADLEVALLVEDTPGVRWISLARLNTPLVAVPDVRRETITGVTDDLTALLDIEALLTNPRLRQSTTGQRGLNSGRDFRSAPPAVADLLNTTPAGRSHAKD